MHAGVGSGGEFGADAVVEEHAIIARMSLFVSVAERGGLIKVARCAERYIGVKKHIGEVGAARTAKVIVRKAEDLRVAVVITAASVPVAGASVGAELHGSMRCGGTRIGVTMCAGADKGVDVASYLFCIGRLPREQR